MTRHSSTVAEISADYIETRLDSIDDSLKEISLFFKMMRREKENADKCKSEAQDAMLQLMKAVVNHEDGKCCRS